MFATMVYADQFQEALVYGGSGAGVFGDLWVFNPDDEQLDRTQCRRRSTCCSPQPQFHMDHRPRHDDVWRKHRQRPRQRFVEVVFFLNV